MLDWSWPVLFGSNQISATTLVDTLPRGSYSFTAEIHRVQFRSGPTDVGMGDGAWRDAPLGRTPDGAFLFSDPWRCEAGLGSHARGGRHDRIAGASKVADRESVETDLHG